MPKEKLSHRMIEGLLPVGKPVTYYDTIKSGLMLRLSKAGSKIFSYRYKFAGKKRRYNIGKFPAVSLSEARKTVQRIKV